MTNQVFTYVDAVAEDSTQLRALTDIWERAWAAAGFDPLIATERTNLTGADVALHAATTRTYPTINPRHYEDASWERWSAYVNVVHPDGAFFADIDVFPVTFTADDIADIPSNPASGIALLHEGIMPSLIAATPAGLTLLRDVFTAPGFAGLRDPILLNGRTHLSDMHVLARWAPGALDLTIARPCEVFRGVYPNPPAVVHFATYSCLQTGFPSRAAAIKAFARGHGLGDVWGPFTDLE